MHCSGSRRRRRAIGRDDVNAAYDHLGAASAAYQELAAKDLTNIIGTGTPKKLMATVRWCFGDEDCPFPNAFWDGTQMVFGTGYAGADDAVAHELTHGYVERTSALFSVPPERRPQRVSRGRRRGGRRPPLNPTS